MVNGLCGFAEYGPPPPGHVASNLAPRSSEASEFVTEHIPCFIEERKTCVVCWQKEKKQYKVQTYCKAPQCNKYMHITGEKIVSSYIIQRITRIIVEILKNCNFLFLYAIWRVS